MHWQLGLTRREAEVARLLAKRRTNAEIARALGVSPFTARRHTESVLRKLGVRSRYDVERAIAGGGHAWRSANGEEPP